MTRILVHVEGLTEENFVNEILAEHLQQYGYTKIDARTMGKAQQRHRRGGIRGWQETKRDVVGHLRRDARGIGTTMVNYYGLPERGASAWPGRSEAHKKPLPDRATHVEDAIHRDLQKELGGGFQARRFCQARGDELGRFHLGSTVVLLHADGGWRWDEAVAVSKILRYGQLLAAPEAGAVELEAAASDNARAAS